MHTTFTRRQFARLIAAAAACARLPRAFAQNVPPPRQIAAGPFQPTWESLTANYKTPEWFRDAKFGMWAHWTAQCVPEQGDWYARRMYVQGEKDYDYHVKTYGHPSKVGFMEIDNLWKAEKWNPEHLIGLYKRAGAKYFFAMGAHHDNFDMFDSAHHDWNSVKVGPKKDLVGTWAKIVRANGLRFGISNHNSWAARWLQPAYGYDGEGPLEGVRYDAYTLTNARLTWRSAKRDLSVALAVTNVFNKYYYTSKFDLTGAGAGVIAGSPGRPREWAVTVKKTF